jgi:GAF domain-containing protein
VCAHGCTGCDLCGPGHSLKIGKGMVGYVASTGQMHYAADVRQDPYYIGCEESILSEVAIPLHVERQLVGVFTASHDELNAFSPCQLRLLQALCSDVAVAVHNARRFQQVQQPVRSGATVVVRDPSKKDPILLYSLCVQHSLLWRPIRILHDFAN